MGTRSQAIFCTVSDQSKTPTHAPMPGQPTRPQTPHRTTDKRPIARQKPTTGPPFKGSKRPSPPLRLCQNRPLLGDPVAHGPVVPGRQKKGRPCRSGGVGMDITRPAQHGCLVLGQPSIPKTSRMDTQLLPVQVPHLEHSMLGEEWVRMIAAHPPSQQTASDT